MSMTAEVYVGPCVRVPLRWAPRLDWRCPKHGSYVAPGKYCHRCGSPATERQIPEGQEAVARHEVFGGEEPLWSPTDESGGKPAHCYWLPNDGRCVLALGLINPHLDHYERPISADFSAREVEAFTRGYEVEIAKLRAAYGEAEVVFMVLTVVT